MALFSKTQQIDPKSFGPKLDEFQEPRFLEQVKLFFDRAASKTDIPQEYLGLIKACNTVIRFNIPLRRDNGTVETITCYRYVFPAFAALGRRRTFVRLILFGKEITLVCRV